MTGVKDNAGPPAGRYIILGEATDQYANFSDSRLLTGPLAQTGLSMLSTSESAWLDETESDRGVAAGNDGHQRRLSVATIGLTSNAEPRFSFQSPHSPRASARRLVDTPLRERRWRQPWHRVL